MYYEETLFLKNSPGKLMLKFLAKSKQCKMKVDKVAAILKR